MMKPHKDQTGIYNADAKPPRQNQFTPKDFGPITLSAGAHDGPWDGMCVMEAVSFLSGESWTDAPACSSPAISRFAQIGNDRMDQENRDRLQLYVLKLIGTASPEHERERAEYLAWQAVRVFAPIALDAANLGGLAQRLRNFHGSLADAVRAAADAADAARAAYAADAARAADAAADAADAVYAAARAADAAARAADAAADAADAVADAADAVYAAARAADAADAVRANSNAGWDAYFAALDGVIAIGPHGEGYQPEHMARVPALKKALTTA